VVLVVMVVQGVVLRTVIILPEQVFLGKVMTVVRRLMVVYPAAAAERVKQETRIVKVTAVTV
jgi:hypothetical protein